MPRALCDHLLPGMGRSALTELADGVAHLERLGVVEGQVEHQGDGAIRLDLRLLRLADLELGHLQLGPDRQDVGLPDEPGLEELLVAGEELADPRRHRSR